MFALALVLLLAASVVLIVFIRDYAERASDRAFDRLLAASALTIAGAVQVEDEAVVVEIPFAAFAMFSGQDRVFYAVEDPDGRTVTGYEDLAVQMAETVSAEPSFVDVSYRGEMVRVASVGRLISTASDTGWVTIHVAETQNQRESLSNEILSNAVWPVVILTLLAVGLVWFGISRMFAPLTQLEHELRARAPDDLSPITVPVPEEVDHLVAALNGFMGRLHKAMERVTGLVAEAAHEVRTPLASLRAQAEVAMDETDPEALRRRVERIHTGAVQASQLVSQLLMEATISHRMENAEIETTTLAAVVEDVRQRLDPEQAGRLDIAVSAPAAEAPLRGDRVALREMMRNLVDNALVYSQDCVEIAGRIDNGSLVVEVSDRGPGIAAGEKSSVLERFKRGAASSGKVGSGLGLSIVARVTRAHGGTLALLDRAGGGLTVSIVLPLSRRSQPARAGSVLALLAGLVLAPLAVIAPAPVEAATTVYPARDGTSAKVLNILGVTDTPLFAHFVEAFHAQRLDVTVVYEETDSLPLFQNFLAGQLQTPPDLLISSASDLQLKLANDGHALAYDSPYLPALPDWAHWRNEVFGFTFEPAVIIYNPSLISDSEVPRTHLTLAELLEHLVATKEIWLAAIEGADLPQGGDTSAAGLLARHDAVAPRWLATVRDLDSRGAWDDRLVDALCDPPESFVMASVFAHVVTYAAARRQLARHLLRGLGVAVDDGDPITWVRRQRGEE